MRIGFVEDTHLRGGTQLRVTRAMKFFQDNGHTVSLIAPIGSPVEQHAISLGAQTFSYDFDDIAITPDIYESVRSQGLAQMDVVICTVHPPRNNFHCSIFAASCIKKNQLPTILIPKTGTIVPSYLREYYYTEDGVHRHVICITEFTKRYLIEHYRIPSSSITLIYQGTSLAHLNDDKELIAKEAYPLGKSDTFVFLQLGMFEYRKGRDITLQAFEDIQSVAPNTSLMFVGEGPDHDELVAKAQHSSGDIHIYPFTPTPHVALARCNCLLLPSREKEGLPNVLLEAMAMKKVVIGSDLGGIHEVIRHNSTGLLTIPGDEHQLSVCMKNIVTDRDQYNMLAQQGQNLIFEAFDEQKQFGIFLDLFLSLHAFNTRDI